MSAMIRPARSGESIFEADILKSKCSTPRSAREMIDRQLMFYSYTAAGRDDND